MALALGLAVFAWASSARAAVDTWSNLASAAFYEFNGNWADGSRPTATDSVVFDRAGTYSVLSDAVTYSYYGNAAPHVLDLDVSTGNVSFKTNDTPRRTLVVGSVTESDVVQVRSGSLSLGESGNAARAFELYAHSNIEIQTGALNVYPGSRLAAHSQAITVGTVSGSTGTLFISGTESTLETTSVIVGQTGNGEFMIQSGGVALARDLIIASGPGTTGVATITGPGSRLESSFKFIVGNHESGTATFRVLSGGAVLLRGGNLYVGRSDNYDSSNGTVEIESATFTQTSPGGEGRVEVGHWVSGSGKIDIKNAGVFTTGGLWTDVFKTGLIDLNAGGTFNANSDVTIYGGTFDNTGGTFNLAAGKNVTVRDMGTFNYSGGYALGNNSTLTVNSGSTATFGSYLDLGGGSTGTLNVDGTGSSVVTSIASIWGADGGSAVVSATNGALLSVTGLQLANSPTTGTSAAVQVLSGADLTMSGGLSVAASGGTTSSASLTVGGAGSSVTQTGASSNTIGHASTGTARIEINSGGTFTSGAGTTTVNKTGTIDLNAGGTYNANGHIVIIDGTFDNTGGTFNLAAGKNVTVQNTGTFNHSGSYSLRNNSTLTVNSGSTATFGSYLDIGVGSTGTLNVDGSGSSLATSVTSYWGDGGGSAVVSAANAGALNLSSGLELALSSTAGTSATVQLLSGADMTIGGTFTMASNGGVTTSASLTVDGAGSSVTQSGNSTVVIGHASTGAATLTVRNSASFATTGVAHNTDVLRTGRINIESGGAFNSVGDVVLDGGTLHHDGGSLTLASGKKLQANNLGVVETLGGTLAVSTLETFPGSAVNVGQLSPARMSTMNVTTWTAVGGTTYVAPGSTLSVTNLAFNPGATLNVDGGGTANVTNATITGGTTLGDGTLNLEGAINFASATTLGVPTAFRNGATVSFNTTNYDLQISRRAFIDAGVTFTPGSGTHLLVNQAASGLSLEPGSNVGIPLINLGTIRLSENSPFATATVAGFQQNATGTIFFDLLNPAQLDRFIVTGFAGLVGGTLDVQSQPGFTPVVGQSFDLFDWNGGVSGAFTNVLLPTLGGGLGWNTSQLYTTGVLSIVAAVGVLGDYNNNGTVDAADYVLWRNGGPLANEVDTPGTVNAADYTAWRARFGNTSGSGAGASVAVPEPTALAFFVIAALRAIPQRRRRITKFSSANQQS